MIISKEREKRRDTIDVAVVVVRNEYSPFRSNVFDNGIKDFTGVVMWERSGSVPGKKGRFFDLIPAAYSYSFLFSAAHFFPSTFLPRMINENELIFVVIKETASRWLSLPTLSPGFLIHHHLRDNCSNFTRPTCPPACQPSCPCRGVDECFNCRMDLGSVGGTRKAHCWNCLSGGSNREATNRFYLSFISFPRVREPSGSLRNPYDGRVSQ